MSEEYDQNWEDGADRSTPEEHMTLVVVAIAVDGVVMASDSRETIQGPPPWSFRDDAKKLVRIGSQALIGVASGGIGVDVLVEHGTRNGEINTLDTTANIAAAVSAISTHQKRKPFVGIVAGVNPSPTMIGVEYKLYEGTHFVWSVTEVSERYRCLGIPFLGHWLFSRMWRDTMDVQEAAALCVSAVRASAESFPYVGGPVHVDAIRTDGRTWTATDSERAFEAADTWLVGLRDYRWTSG